MSEIAGQTGLHGGAAEVVNESYSFACMHCGHGWEQSYEIEHHRDAEGQEFVMYVANGQVVPSPLSRPQCQNCDGHLLRIMRAGQVSSARDAAHGQHRVPHRRQAPDEARAAGGPAEAPTDPSGAEGTKEHHHWHLSDLLHPFRKAG